MQQQEQKAQPQNHRQQNKKKTKKLVAVTMVAVCILLMIGFAWYYYLTHRETFSEEREVMPPYYLYLVDPNGTDKLSLTVGDLHPGETKQIVLGVSNKQPDNDSETGYTIGKDSKFNYELELAYTQNLPVSYNVYELQKTDEQTGGNSGISASDKVTVEWKDNENQLISQEFTRHLLTRKDTSDAITRKNNEEMYGESDPVNLGQYDVYDNTSGATFDLSTKVVDDTVTFDVDYYMIEIRWKDGIHFADYLKETDLVYVIVNAMQLEPTESQ